MKTLLIIWLLLSTVVVNGQLYVILEPAFLRPGIVYNHSMEKIGIWGKIWYGNIRGVHPDGGTFYTDNIKTSIGISTPYDGARWFVGVNYNLFFNTNEDNRLVQLDDVESVSLDIGVSLTRGRFSAIMMTDPFNWESCVGVSYTFKDQRCAAYKPLVKQRRLKCTGKQ